MADRGELAHREGADAEDLRRNAKKRNGAFGSQPRLVLLADQDTGTVQDLVDRSAARPRVINNVAVDPYQVGAIFKAVKRRVEIGPVLATMSMWRIKKVEPLS